MSYGVAAALQAAVFQRLVAQLPGVAVHDALPSGTAPGTFVLLGPEEALDASRLFATQLRHALNGEDKHLILVGHRARVSAPAIVDIARGDVATWQAQGIRGSGYVVQSLRAALWCFASTDSFEQAVLAAANLGDDADTTAAICGQLAGAYYGVQAIPEAWRERIVQAELINQLSDQLQRANTLHMVAITV